MAFEGGPLNVIGITPSVVTQTLQTAASTASVAGLQQVWQGAGQSFFGQAGQALTGNLAGSAVNIALNAALGSEVAGPGGFNLTSGATVLASTVTPFVTTSVAAGINQSISNSLQNAGPFAGVLSGVSTSLVNAAVGGITNAIFGGAVGGFAEDYKSFPGGSDSDPDADYGGIAYTRTDVVFSIQPANAGTQTFGDQSFDYSTVATDIGLGTLNGDVFGAGSPYSVDAMKSSIMEGNFEADVTGLSTGLA